MTGGSVLDIMTKVKVRALIMWSMCHYVLWPSPSNRTLLCYMTVYPSKLLTLLLLSYLVNNVNKYNLIICFAGRTAISIVDISVCLQIKFITKDFNYTWCDVEWLLLSWSHAVRWGFVTFYLWSIFHFNFGA